MSRQFYQDAGFRFTNCRIMLTEYSAAEINNCFSAQVSDLLGEAPRKEILSRYFLFIFSIREIRPKNSRRRGIITNKIKYYNDGNTFSKRVTRLATDHVRLWIIRELCCFSVCCFNVCSITILNFQSGQTRYIMQLIEKVLETKACLFLRFQFTYRYISISCNQKTYRPLSLVQSRGSQINPPCDGLQVFRRKRQRKENGS